MELFILAGFLMAFAAVASRGLRAQPAQLGSVSERWLAEYRASNPGR